MTRSRKLRAWPGTYRPVWVIAEYTGRSADSFRTWYKNGELPGKVDEHGEVLVDVVAAFKLHETKPQRRRARSWRPA